MAKRAAKKHGDPIHPGEILADELEVMNMTAADLAVRLGVPKNRMYEIINEKRGITADTAMRLGAFFGGGPEIWLNLQRSYELDLIRDSIADELKSIKRYDPAANPPAQQPSLAL